jgi:NAD-dependent DNA ligase
MNSKLFNYFFRWYKQEEGKTFAQVKTVDVKALPFVYSNQNEVVELVDSLLNLTNKNSVESSNLQAEIDKLVYKIFNLSEAEIKEVESFGAPTK